MDSTDPVLQEILRRVQAIDERTARQAPAEAKEMSMAEYQATLYADMANRVDWNETAERNTAAQFPARVLHPDLRLLSMRQLSLRSHIFAQRLYNVAAGDVINWHAELRRTFEGGDGGNGMFATDAMAAAWPDRADDGSVTVGPA